MGENGSIAATMPVRFRPSFHFYFYSSARKIGIGRYRSEIMVDLEPKKGDICPWCDRSVLRKGCRPIKTGPGWFCSLECVTEWDICNGQSYVIRLIDLIMRNTIREMTRGRV